MQDKLPQKLVNFDICASIIKQKHLPYLCVKFMGISSLDRHYAAELKVLRKSHRIKQSVMAEYLGISTQQLYSDLENGKKHFTDDLILKICSVFHISILEFINDNNSSSNLSTILSNTDYDAIQKAKDNETKLLIYKKLFLETKIENIENRLKLLNKRADHKINLFAQPKIHVII